MGGFERQEIQDGPCQDRMVLHGATFGFHFYADLLGFYFCNRCGYASIFYLSKRSSYLSTLSLVPKALFKI